MTNHSNGLEVLNFLIRYLHFIYHIYVLYSKRNVLKWYYTVAYVIGLFPHLLFTVPE